MNCIRISEDEKRGGRLSVTSVTEAINAIRRDGYVVLSNAVSSESITCLNAKMLDDLPQFLDRRDAPFNFNRSNIQHDPPPFSPYLFRDILVNEFVIQVTSGVLGPGVKNGYYSGNTALNFEGMRQPVHADVGQLWPDLPLATPAFGLVVNVPLVAVSSKNGSTEIWPGTHLDTSVAAQSGDIKVTAQRLEERQMTSPPFQPEIEAGSVLIRDIRMWHGGMPNHTDVPRVMVAMIHWVHWWNDNDIPTFSAQDLEFFKHPVLRTSAHFDEGTIEYIHKSDSYDFREVGESGSSACS